MYDHFRGCFKNPRQYNIAKTLGIAGLLSPHRSTISNAIVQAGQKDKDWSSSYRLFNKAHNMDIRLAWRKARDIVRSEFPSKEALIILDDTHLRKSGIKIYGTKYGPDPLGPKFQINFIWKSRWIQYSIVINPNDVTAKAIPIDFIHAPQPKKPKKNASLEEEEEYKILKSETRMPLVGAEAMNKILEEFDSETRVIVCYDGGYTNRTFCRALPSEVTQIGRIRKDAKLFESPTTQDIARGGRKRYYGKRMATPEQTLKDSNIAFKEIEAYSNDTWHTFSVKSVVCRSELFGNKDIKVLVVSPLGYRKTKNGGITFKDPAYIICSNSNMPDERILQAYLHRWKIEVSFRDEKSIIGIHHPQARTKTSVENVHPFMVLNYALLSIAAEKTLSLDTVISRAPKWRLEGTILRPSTLNMLEEIRLNDAHRQSLLNGHNSSLTGNYKAKEHQYHAS